MQQETRLVTCKWHVCDIMTFPAVPGDPQIVAKGPTSVSEHCLGFNSSGSFALRTTVRKINFNNETAV